LYVQYCNRDTNNSAVSKVPGRVASLVLRFEKGSEMECLDFISLSYRGQVRSHATYQIYSETPQQSPLLGFLDEDFAARDVIRASDCNSLRIQVEEATQE